MLQRWREDETDEMEEEIDGPATEWFPASALGASQYPVRMKPVKGRVEWIARGCLNTVLFVSLESIFKSNTSIVHFHPQFDCPSIVSCAMVRVALVQFLTPLHFISSIFPTSSTSSASPLLEYLSLPHPGPSPKTHGDERNNLTIPLHTPKHLIVRLNRNIVYLSVLPLRLCTCKTLQFLHQKRTKELHSSKSHPL